MKPPAKHLPAEERRSVIVETTIALAAEQNPGDITTSAIAARMSLTQGALFRHFASKDAIWQAVAEWVSERLLARVEQAVAGVPSPLAALEAAFFSHIDFVASYPGVPRMVFGELQRAEDSPAKRVIRALLRRYGERLVRLIEAGQASGEIAPEVDAAAAATLFIGTIQGLVMQALLAGEAGRIRQEAPGAFAIYRRGLAGGARP